MGWFSKKKVDETNLLELMKYHIVNAQNEIKKIQKESSNLANSRLRDPTWSRRAYNGQKEYISDAESNQFSRDIRKVEKELLQKLTPLVEKLQESANR